MSRHDYERSYDLARRDEPFYALIMAAMRKADSMNAARLRREFPDTWNELQARYDAPAGLLPDDPDYDEQQWYQQQ